MRTLLIDNYDSFTFNLHHLLAEVTGREPTVVANDACAWEALDPGVYDAAVISPGPGRPDRRRDVGLSADLLYRSELPVLGVCLGHQLLCHVHGAQIRTAPQPVHGRVTAVHHGGHGLFAGLTSPLRAVRYHSLVATSPPPRLEVLARDDDGLVMAVRERGALRFGVQFHPEAVLTDGGRRLVANFAALVGGHDLPAGAGPARPPRPAPPARSARAGPHLSPPAVARPGAPAPRLQAAPVHGGGPGGRLTLRVRYVERPPDPAAAYRALFAGSPASFWLDRGAPSTGARFSYMGDGTGPRAELVTYDVAGRTVTIRRRGGTVRRPGPLLDHLERSLERRRVAAAGLPFAFDLGYVGYLGYELKAECGGAARHRAPTPDAALLFADRMLAFDHRDGGGWLVALADRDDPTGADRWLEATAASLDALPPPPADAGPPHAGPPHAGSPHAGSPHAGPPDTGSPGGDLGGIPVAARHGPRRYLELIASCQRAIRAGESYEICLTNMLRVDADIDPVRTYLAYRRRNPAPFGALLRLPDLSVLSASPERFLLVGADGTVETRPIKGTAPRGATPVEDAALAAGLAASVKDQAENLMVVDLSRHDLGRVCEIGTVRVPELFAVESYATVHQLVSTVRGRLRRDRTPLDAVRAAFPGGSMTGAPKQRTMELIDELEGGARGVYSGALGYIALGGAVDLSMVIRTLVATAGRVTLGVGGAIVALSDPRAELDEARLKARAGLETLAAVAARPRAAAR